MDFIALATTWFWYVMAFAAGMLVAWLLARQFVPAQHPREAIDLAVADLRRRHAERDDEDVTQDPAGPGSTAAEVRR
ncbi:hypothetical protein [Mobilicoccus caccae]|uniref:Uncharacterized protein n=1 Tax=Mobilicoccus caccae TaxID=1859295 RepID=A0ABQ6IY67_9MICO|nr:hypothetical protein [Mobilicoccus caccae]GMA41639.1 hypothetical protein GCM10025883_36840 [Mobilicoccus caccae]